MDIAVGERANPYEQERAARIKRNRAVLHDLGLSTNLIDDAAAAAAKRNASSRKQAAAAKRATAAPEAAPPPERRSRRLQGGPAPPLDPTCGGGEEGGDGDEGQRRLRAARAAASARLAAATDDAGLTEHNLHRVRTMTDKALQTRIWKIQRVDKLRSFIQVRRQGGAGSYLVQAPEARRPGWACMTTEGQVGPALRSAACRCWRRAARRSWRRRRQGRCRR